jgi:RimJ/RimL family protein N-acetyltransferase
MSDEIVKYPLAIFKTCLAGLKTYENELNLHRIEVAVKDSFKEGLRFAEALGFVREGWMHRYGPDKSSYYLYARVK